MELFETLFHRASAAGVLLFAVGWLGHFYLWCDVLNTLYGLPLRKWFLRPWRLLTGLIIVFGYPAILEVMFRYIRAVGYPAVEFEPVSTCIGFYWLTVIGCGLVYPFVTLYRCLRRPPAVLISSHSRKLDLWKIHGSSLIGDGKWAKLTRLPLNDPFTVEFTELTLKLPSLPPTLDGLTILLLSDFHFCGTPSQVYFDAILKEIDSQPTPDIVALPGDFVDSLKHHEWLAPLLSRLKWNEAGFAILGNHDEHYGPEQLRNELAGIGFTVLSNLSNRFTIRSIRGESVLFVGHEGPWLRPIPKLSAAPEKMFCIALSHTPDNFYWAIHNRIDLVLAGHVHGGQIRLPVIGSIFCPSIYGRRFDQGVFQKNGTTMVVSRGLSGKEPIRFRCPAQVIRITLTKS